MTLSLLRRHFKIECPTGSGKLMNLFEVAKEIADRLEPDVVMECTGVGPVISQSIGALAANGILCLTGVGHGGAVPRIATADVASSAVLKNIVAFGSVNANKRHWYKAGE